MLSRGAPQQIAAVIGVALVAALAGCGAAQSGGSEVTLASWRESACSSLKTLSKEAPPLPVEPDAAALSESSADQLELMRAVVTELRKIPLPTDAGDRADVERLVDTFMTLTDDYEQALPRMEAASRLLDQVMKEVAEDDTALPPAPEGSTVASGIMTQLMSVPRFRDAWNEYVAASAAAMASVDEAEFERLEKRLGLEQCEEPPEEEQLSQAELERCRARGASVSVQELVNVFRAHDIELELDRTTCAMSASERSGGAAPDATSDGEEGYLHCRADDSGGDGTLLVNKYPTESETTFSVHNISCAFYPRSTATEAEQLARVKRAMQAVGAANP